MSFWYPDNTNRRDRADQLSNDVTLIQNIVQEAHVAMDKSDARMLPFINQYLKSHNMQSFDDLQKKLNALMTPEQKRLYDDLIKRAELVSDGSDNALMGTSAIMLTSGIIMKTIDLGNFLRAGHVLITFRSYAKAFMILLKDGVDAGRAAFRAASAASDLAVEALQDASKLAKYASTASSLLKTIALIGIFADAFILGFALYEEGQQRDALRGAINQLYVTRIIAKFYEQMCDSIKTQDGYIASYLLFVGENPVAPDDQTRLPQINEDWKTITATSSLDLLVLMDKQQSSWTNEDPTYRDAIDAAEKNRDIKPVTTSAANVSSITRGEQMIAITRESKANFVPIPTALLMQSVANVQDLTKAHLRAVLEL